jgi:hypothetical protein
MGAKPPVKDRATYVWFPPQAVITSLGYTPERHHGKTLNPVSFGWFWALGTVRKEGLGPFERQPDLRRAAL